MSDAAALKQEARFQDLDRVLQSFIETYAQGQTQLKDFMSKEHQETRRHITETHESSEFRRDRESHRKQLIASLKDKDMNTRKNQIEKSHTDTFSWIYDEELQRPGDRLVYYDDTQQQWDSFTDWLSSEGSLYWICGKAGSGKSTLMKFLATEERTKQQLHKWASVHSIYTHFIWNSGTGMQRSIEGLLRSLLYQILQANEYILDSILQKRPEISKIQHLNDWSRGDLEDLLFQSLSSHQKAVCIFVDGLDEIDHTKGPFDLLDLMERISSLPHKIGIKICVSSRPEASFIHRLETYPKLKLQDLTRYDMEIYTTDFLRNKCSFNLQGADESRFIREVVGKAEGVFLWVSLALKSLQRGLINGDDEMTLMERLRTLPSELGQLYEEMLNRLGDDQHLYSKESALFFNIYLVFSEMNLSFQFGHPNLFHFAAAVDLTLRDILFTQNRGPPTKINEILLKINRKLMSRCAGILEAVCPEGEGDVQELLSGEEIRPWEVITIELLHRSAKEFLLSMKDKLLDQKSPVERKFRVLQALALDDLYLPKRNHINEWIGQNMAMENMVYTESTLPDKEQLDILNVIHEVHQRNGWTEFYEVAAYYGLHQAHGRLLEGQSGDSSALLNYLLICALSYYTPNTSTMVSFLLERGADINWMCLLPVDIADRDMWFPVPLLAYFITYATGSRTGVDGRKLFLSFLEFGEDMKQKFLCYDCGHSTGTGRVEAKYRPSYRVESIFSESFIVERNYVDVILQHHLEREDFTQAEMSATLSRLGLDAVKAHYKILLYFHKSTAYGADDEDSDAINEILVELRSKRLEERTKEICKEYFDRIYEILKGKEVEDVKQWLVDKGYNVLDDDDSDIKQISDKASIHEMAEIYRRLNGRFGRRPQG